MCKDRQTRSQIILLQKSGFVPQFYINLAALNYEHGSGRLKINLFLYLGVQVVIKNLVY
jgi:hypothetical protein